MEKKEKNVAKSAARQKRRKRTRIILLSLLGALIIFRLFLPSIVLHYVNKKLANLSEYTGHVEDIDIALLRGAYVINGLKLEKIDNGKNDKVDTIPFFSSPVIDLSVEWSAIFKGSVVGEIYVEDPVLNFVKGTHKGEDVRADTSDFRTLIKDLMPLTINHFEVKNGQIHYIDPNIKPGLDLSMKEVSVVGTNLSNVNDSAKLLPAHVDAKGTAYGGNFSLKVDFDALNKIPTFDMNAELTSVELAKVNDFLKAYGNFEAKQGTFGLYTEFAAKEGSFGGYVKPVIKDLKVQQMEGGIKDMIWEAIVGGAAIVLKNQSENQVATKVPIEGRFDKPDINIWRAISFVLRNAFVHALKPAIDNSINIHKLDEGKPTLLEKIFGKKKDKDKKK